MKLHVHGVVVLATGCTIWLHAPVWASWAAPGGGSGATNDFPCVGQVGISNTNGGVVNFGCSGTVVGNGQYVITAKHCLRTDPLDPATQIDNAQKFGFRLGNTTYYGQSMEIHPTADLAIICLGVTLPDAYQLYCPPAGTDITGASFVGVGFGLGSSAGGTATSTWDLPYGTKRRFNNTVDNPDTPGLFGENGTIRYDLDVGGGAPAGEGLHAPGDSGGAMFFNNGGTFQLMGVFSYGIGAAPPVGFIGPRPGFEGGAVSTLFYKDWITPRIPTPASSIAFLFAACAFGRRRRSARA